MTPSLSLQDKILHFWICSFIEKSVKPNTTLKLNGSFCASYSICIYFRKAYYMVVITLSLPWHSSLYYMAPEQAGDVVESAIGWLLDVTVERNAATGREPQNSRYQPSFYILPRNEQAGTELFHILSPQPKTRVEWQRKLTDIDARRSEIVLCVYLHKTIIHSLRGRRTTQE